MKKFITSIKSFANILFKSYHLSINPNNFIITYNPLKFLQIHSSNQTKPKWPTQKIKENIQINDLYLFQVLKTKTLILHLPKT